MPSITPIPEIAMPIRITLLAFAIAFMSPLAHASMASDAHAFKEGVKEAGRKTGHAVADVARTIGHGARDAGTAIGHGARDAGHAVADTTKRGYRATKEAIKGEDKAETRGDDKTED